jgi:hypothetical protein
MNQTGSGKVVAISKKIVGYKVKAGEVTKAPTHLPMERPEEISGKTYKIKPSNMDHAMYITINDVVIDGVTRPYELFINCKHVESFQWVMIFTRLVSAIFRQGGDYQFAIDEMKATFDPGGGYFKRGQGHVPSLVADIGSVIEQHIKELR